MFAKENYGKYIDGSEMGLGKSLATLMYIDYLLKDNPG